MLCNRIAYSAKCQQFSSLAVLSPIANNLLNNVKWKQYYHFLLCFRHRIFDIINFNLTIWKPIEKWLWKTFDFFYRLGCNFHSFAQICHNLTKNEKIAQQDLSSVIFFIQFSWCSIQFACTWDKTSTISCTLKLKILEKKSRKRRNFCNINGITVPFFLRSFILLSFSFMSHNSS